MSKDEIIAMAKEAGFPPHIIAAGANRELARFAAMVEEKEREACAVLLENRAENIFAECPPSDRENFAAACEADWCADLVRARGKP